MQNLLNKISQKYARKEIELDLTPLFDEPVTGVGVELSWIDRRRVIKMFDGKADGDGNGDSVSYYESSALMLILSVYVKDESGNLVRLFQDSKESMDMVCRIIQTKNLDVLLKPLNQLNGFIAEEVKEDKAEEKN